MKVVYFEIFGKKMKTEVDTDSDLQAKQIIKNKIIFHAIKDKDDIPTMKDINDFTDEFLDKLKKGIWKP